MKRDWLEGFNPRGAVLKEDCVRMAKIINATSKVFNVRNDEIIGRTRNKAVASARQVVYMIARTSTEMTLPQIGKVMKRDHTTVLYGINKASERAEKDQQFADMIGEVRGRLAA